MRNRIEKTINAVKKLHSCNENTKVTHIYKDTNNNDYIVLFQTTRLNSYSKKMATFTEYVTMNNRYVWGLRVGYFCSVKEQAEHFEKLDHYERVY